MMMNHVSPFLDGMHSRNPDSLGEHLAENVVLESPIFPEPFVGKEAALGVLKVLLSGIDQFEATNIIAGESRAAIMLRIRAGDAEVTGVDDLSVDTDGRIVRMSIQWRPLEQIVAIQQRLAPLVGAPKLRLVQM
ncbi:nuclear transport factor 2 family protein [Bradyrhizobium pachyrhizi]|uniref:nuclear transport factor 2 family protein n=1 Tax=Bradyrhizobium pachyrhizi TaxID=280333 RepID=UPI003D362EC2